ncbi:hypothetical protein HAX54_014525, partial [Datura stramonium]|nr:hypothetical protein [Datura stramonium]
MAMDEDENHQQALEDEQMAMDEDENACVRWNCGCMNGHGYQVFRMKAVNCTEDEQTAMDEDENHQTALRMNKWPWMRMKRGPDKSETMETTNLPPLACVAALSMKYEPFMILGPVMWSRAYDLVMTEIDS